MAIFFFCLCGQNLREEEHRAGGYSRCPTCGRSVRVPFLNRDNSAKAITSIVPVLELKAVQVEETVSEDILDRKQPVYRLDDEPLPNHDDEFHRAVRKEARRIYSESEREYRERRRREGRWKLEKHVWQYLFYPLRAWPLIFCLALAWAMLLTFIVAAAPLPLDGGSLLPQVILLSFTFGLLGWTCGWFRATLACATAGQAGFVVGPGRDPIWIVRSATQAILCIMAGPIVLLIIAYFFWRESGDLTLLDRLILWELTLFAVGYWALAMLAIEDGKRWRDVNPLAVIDLGRRLGLGGLASVLLFSFVMVIHGHWLMSGVDELHHDFGGWLLLFFTWGGLHFWPLFFLRWLGVSRYRAWKAGRVEPAEIPAVQPTVLQLAPAESQGAR